MKTTPKRRKMINDSIKEGYTVVEKEFGVDINVGKTRRSVGITLWPDGTATRNDCDLTICAAIRTVKEMRKCLGLWLSKEKPLPVALPVCDFIMDIINS